MTQEVSTWKRPDSVPYPSVWRRHEGVLEMPDGKKPKFIIQDLTEDRLEEVIDLYATIFCRDESIFSNSKMYEDEVSLRELGQFYRNMFHDRVSVVALLDDGSAKPRIAGSNMMFVSRIQDKYDPNAFTGRAIRRVTGDCCGYAASFVNIYEHYGVKEYLGAFGLLVHRDFRGQGLGPELLRARENLCKAVGLKATMTYFTSVGGQRSGQKAGMELLAEIPYSVFKTEDGQEAYPGVQPKSMKIMGKSFQ